MWLIRRNNSGGETLENLTPIEGDYIFGEVLQILLDTLQPLFKYSTFTAFSRDNVTLIIYYIDIIYIKFTEQQIIINMMGIEEKFIQYDKVDPLTLFDYLETNITHTIIEEL